MKSNNLMYRDFNELKNAIKELQNDQTYRFQDHLKTNIQILTDTFPVPFLTQFAQYCHVHPPFKWINDLETLTVMLGPKSKLFAKILYQSKSRLIIDKKLVPKSVLATFPQNFNHEYKPLSLKRENTGGFTIAVFEWFFVSLINGFINMGELESSLEPLEHYEIDDFFYFLTRNPYLILIRQFLEAFSEEKGGQRFKRLVNILEIYFVEEVNYKCSNGKKEGDEINYKLKSHHMYIIYLLIKFKTTAGFTEESLYDFLNYFQNITEKYSSLSQFANNSNIKNIIRIWIYFLTRETSPEVSVIESLSKANRTDGWFKLKRYSLTDFEGMIQEMTVRKKDERAILKIRELIIKLLKKSNEWPANPSYLFVIKQLLILDRVVKKNLRMSSVSNEIQIIRKSLIRTYQSFLEQTNQVKQIISQSQSIFSTNYEVKSNYTQKFEEEPTPFMKNQTRKKFINYQTNRQMNAWQYPLQENQFYILYKLFYGIAKQFDKLIPGQRKHPFINIRILANPVVFLVTIVLILVLFKQIF